MGFFNDLAPGQSHSPFNNILQLPDIAREIIMYKNFHGLFAYCINILVHQRAILFQEIMGQEGNVILTG